MTAKTRIRALGDGADSVRDYIAEHPPDAVLVDEQEAADLVVIRPEDLDELIEDAAATAAWYRTRDGETVPIELVDRLLAGENPIQVWREYRGLNLTALAAAAGIGKGYLSQLESGERQGPVGTLKPIAAALRVDLDDLVQQD
ncbi:MAG TPA: helix-turn-helix transcriptional regulator [Stellaceae bacterium]|nr:helix-turn-helix transcriptional regulator [Stellaceae bacterium]